ncbi:MAG TPA: chemotaxis protein CheA [Bryobacteraceae bacterium]|nr:chemotaxis protein CheA [Bryobacteraceae bacterium]
MEFDLSRFRETFFQEADEHLAEMEAGLLGLEAKPDPELLNGIFRGAHSIKGASGTFGFEEVTRFTHAMEGLLDAMRAGQISPSRTRIDLLLASLDMLRRLLVAAQSDGAAPPEAEPTMQQLLVARRAGEYVPGTRARVRAQDRQATSWSIRFVPSPEILRQGMDPVLVLRDLGRLGEIRKVQLDLSRLPELANLEPDTCHLAWTVDLCTEASEREIRDAFAFAEDGAIIETRRQSTGLEPPATAADPSPAPIARAVAHSESGTIRVGTGKVDKLIDLVGELVIAQSMAAQVLAAFQPSQLGRLQETFAEVERYTRELQERLMGIRMLPIGNAFSRFPRMVRDLAAATGKQVSLEIQGEETELDKSVVERMADPLTHLVRNAVDHGIEPPNQRAAAGKPPAGVVRLHARHEAGSVVLEISDDGAGLDRDRIFAKAVERGIRMDGDNFSDERIFSLIFEPGFSTAQQVSDISGRGVGLDVVKKSVEALNGAIAVFSEPGHGATFRIKLPLTLAILDGLLLRSGRQVFVLPLISIMESVVPRCDQVSFVAGRGEVIVLRGEPLSLVRLNRLLHLPESGDGLGLAVIVEHHGKRLALQVDELLGQQQVVIKSLEANFRKVEGAIGATILGDGQPALILDVAALAEMARVAVIGPIPKGACAES